MQSFKKVIFKTDDDPKGVKTDDDPKGVSKITKNIIKTTLFNSKH